MWSWHEAIYLHCQRMHSPPRGLSFRITHWLSVNSTSVCSFQYRRCRRSFNRDAFKSDGHYRLCQAAKDLPGKPTQTAIIVQARCSSCLSNSGEAFLKAKTINIPVRDCPWCAAVTPCGEWMRLLCKGELLSSPCTQVQRQILGQCSVTIISTAVSIMSHHYYSKH